MKNSGDSLLSDFRKAALEFSAVFLTLATLISAAAFWFYKHGYLLYYGDAEAHLNISRSIIDSRTPGYDQLGTVWLPLLHVLCLPFAGSMKLWSTGLAGTIPVASCFVIAGLGLYFAAKEVYRDRLAATVVLACFVLNPNILYLASIPMTEIVFLAGLAAMLFAILRYRETGNACFVVLGVLASWSMSLTRYDGWFLIPFGAAGFGISARRKKIVLFLAVAAVAALAPAYWIAHNWWETGNPLDFYNGPYSAAAIQGARSYPGYHDWTTAITYYAAAGKACAGWALIVLGVAGIICAMANGQMLPILFLALTPVFYIWSVHSSRTPIFLPELWPHGYYNSRYGIAVVALAAFAAGAMVRILQGPMRRWSALLILVAISPWLIHPSRENWICWKESEVNSASRRAWTNAAARFLQANYRGGGIWAPFGDVTGIFRCAKIPLHEVLHEGNGPAWLEAIHRPDLYHPTMWAIGQRKEKDPVWRAIEKNNSVYRTVEMISTNEPPQLVIYRRSVP